MNCQTIQNTQETTIICDVENIENTKSTNLLSLTLYLHLTWDEHLRKGLIKINWNVCTVKNDIFATYKI